MKIKCEWTQCQHNDSEFSNGDAGYCKHTGEIELKHTGENKDGEDCLNCTGFKWCTSKPAKSDLKKGDYRIAS